MSGLIEQIQAAYADDAARGFAPVTSASDLPRSFDELTVEWLTDALCGGKMSDGGGIRVTDFDLGEPDNGSSNRRRIALGYNVDPADYGLPSQLFCKASHDLSNRVMLGISGALRAEVNFYNLVRPHTDITAPIAYFATWDERSCNSLILLGDLTGKVASFCDHRTAVNRVKAESQMRLLARLHAAGYANPNVRVHVGSMWTWEQFFEQTCAFGLDVGVRKAFGEAQDLLPVSIRNLSEDCMWDLMVQSVARHSDLPRTITHGDVHLKNWYIADGDAMGLSDWQCSNAGHWSRDVAYTLSTALTVEDRRAWERDLIAYYIDALAAEGGPVVGFEEAWLHYRQQLWTALAWWLVTLTPPEGVPDMQPRDTTEEFITRIGAAMDDAQSHEAFQ